MNTEKNKFKSPGISTKSEMETYINPKLHAIAFAAWVSNPLHNTNFLDDFWNMSDVAQNEVYEYFLKNANK